MDSFVSFIIFLPPILLALTVHEYFHGYVALRMGDPTAKYAGRLTLNPIKHIDLFGLLAFVLFKFGWAKPVPVNPNNFRDIRKGIMYTSVAGPLSNFVCAGLFGIVLRLVPLESPPLLPVRFFLEGFVLFNLILCVFNCIPIPPLDGSNILFSILPPNFAHVEYWLTRYGGYLLLVLILLNALSNGMILGIWIIPIVRFFGTLFAGHLTIF